MREAKRLEEERIAREKKEGDGVCGERGIEEERQRKAQTEERQRVRREKKRIVQRFAEKLGSVVEMDLFKEFCEKTELSSLQAMQKEAEEKGYEKVKAALLKLKEEVCVWCGCDG